MSTILEEFNTTLIYPRWLEIIEEVNNSKENVISIGINADVYGTGKSIAGLLSLCSDFIRMGRQSPSIVDEYRLLPNTRLVFVSLSEFPRIYYEEWKNALSDKFEVECDDNKRKISLGPADLIFATTYTSTIGRAVVGAVVDLPGRADLTRTNLYGILRRIQSRFTRTKSVDNLPFKVWVIEDNELLKYHEPNFWYNEPFWKFRPKSDYSGETFRVVLTSQPFIASSQQDYIDVPVEYKREFETDIKAALKHLAGITQY